jgi:hypothetical protein
MITELGKTAFIGRTQTGEITYVGKHIGQLCCAEGIGYLFNADIYEGETLINPETLSDLLTYDTIIVNFNWCHFRLPKLFRDAGKFVIGYQENDAQHIELFDRDYRNEFQEAIDNCNIFATFQHKLLPFFSSIKTNKDTKVIYIPLPCEDREYYEMRGALNVNRNNRNILAFVEEKRCIDTTLASLNSIEEIETTIVWLKEPNQVWGRKYAVKGTVIPDMGYDDFSNELAFHSLAIRMDLRYVDGRFPKHCAGMGVVCVGSNRVEANSILFPELTFDPLYGTNDVKYVVRQLIDNPMYLIAVLQQAQINLYNRFSKEAVENIIRKQLIL